MISPIPLAHRRSILNVGQNSSSKSASPSCLRVVAVNHRRGNRASPMHFGNRLKRSPIPNSGATKMAGFILALAVGCLSGSRMIGIWSLWRAARAGKTSTLLIPNLLLYRGSTLVLDPKGELANATASWRSKELGHDVFVLDPWGVARSVPDDLQSQFNPLAELLSSDPAKPFPETLIDDASLMAEALIQDQGENSAHWTNSARDFVRSAILYLVASEDREDNNLTDLLVLITEAMGEKNGGESLTMMANFIGGENVPAVITDTINLAGRGLMNTPSNERNSILSTARNQIGFLTSQQMADNLGTSSMRLRDLKRKPVTIYLCLPASRMLTHAKWMRLILNMAMSALELEESTPELPVLLMLEEFAALGHMRALEQASAYMAGFGVKLWAVLQDMSQLKRHYKEGWETFLGNAGVVTVFGNNDQTTLDYVSKRLGDTFVYLQETNTLGSGALAGGAPTTRENFQRVPLLASHEVARSFGRSVMNCLAMPADGAPIAIERHFVNDPASFVELVKSAS